MGIPEPKILVEAGQIPPESAELPPFLSEPELKPFLISFEKYSQKECEVDDLDNKLAKKALKAIRDVGTNIRKESDFSVHLPKLIVKSVLDQGDYRVLFRGIRDSLPDIEMKELKIENDSGRLFFYVVDRIFHIVAIRKNHYDTDKTR